MRRKIHICGIFSSIIALWLLFPGRSSAQTAEFSGQAIGWAVINPPEPFQLQGGLRYIPEFSFTLPAGRFN
ncbi:MAG TPA: hypothetical protein ENO05_00155, partial [Bacteroides sp.]|nr:hypothetical protein [Bacteroides sp.]